MPIEIHVYMYYDSYCKAEVKPLTKGSEDVDEMANAAEVIEKLAREAERLQLLELARSCKDLDELIKKLEAMTANK